MISIFTKIINGDLPGYFIWRDDTAVAFMTITPIKPGHCLVIPRQEINHWDDIPEEIASHLMIISQKIAKALKAVYNPKRVGVMIAGLEVPHAHIHLIPVTSLDDFDFSLQQSATPEELAQEAKKICTKLAELGYQQ